MCEVLGKEKEKKKPSKVIWRGRMVFKAILVRLWFLGGGFREWIRGYWRD